MSKKLCLLFLVLPICSLLVSCNRGRCYSYQQPIENITQIMYINEGVEKEIPPENTRQLLIEIQHLPCKKYWNNRGVALSSPYICVFYIDGSCEVISSAMSYYSDDKGTTEIWKYFEAEAFAQVLDDYST